MQIDSVRYEFMDTTPLPGMVMRLIIRGQNIEQRAMPILAEVGAQSVQWLMPLIGEQGVQGFLAAEPNAGDELRIGYADEPLIATGHKYDPNVA